MERRLSTLFRTSLGDVRAESPALVFGVKPCRVAVLASGRGSHFASLAESSRAGELPIELVGVFSDKPDAPVLQRAAEFAVAAQVFDPKRFADRTAHEAAMFAALDATAPDLIVCAGYMRILGADVVRPRSSRMLRSTRRCCPSIAACTRTAARWKPAIQNTARASTSSPPNSMVAPCWRKRRSPSSRATTKWRWRSGSCRANIRYCAPASRSSQQDAWRCTGSASSWMARRSRHRGLTTLDDTLGAG